MKKKKKKLLLRIELTWDQTLKRPSFQKKRKTKTKTAKLPPSVVIQQKLQPSHNMVQGLQVDIANKSFWRTCCT